jgi:hypothetical protein
MDPRTRPFTTAEYNVREALHANVNVRLVAPLFDLKHFTGGQYRLEPTPASGEAIIQLSTTLVPSETGYSLSK